MAEDADYLYALELHKQWNQDKSDNDIEEIIDTSPIKKQSSKAGKYRSNLDDDYLNRTNNLVHPQWEILDPTPDTQALFHAFDDKFFQSKLRCVTLEWSKRMYSCAGICYSRRSRMGMAVTIRLSEPLLKLRSRKDLVETMLHEMIHAYCFVLGIREGNGGHGPNFKKIMHGINKVAGTNITVYHTFHDEVNAYRTHWWRCNGICQHRAPFFGYVKRTSNRAPGPNDIWWTQHHNTCGGFFMKIKEPEKAPRKSRSKSKAIEANGKAPKKASGSDLRKFFPTTNAGGRPGGPVKTNGGGTLLLNPRTVTSTPESTRPKIPEPKRTSGNLANVVGFKDLGASETPRATNNVRDFSSAGSGYSLTSNSTPKTTAGAEVDRNHLRDVWLKRFGSSTDNAQKDTGSGKPDDKPSGDSKRRRLSTSKDDEVTFIPDEVNTKSDWVVLDDDVMVSEVPNNIISISSSDESDIEDLIHTNNNSPLKSMIFHDADERQKQIKKEIIDESFDLTDGNEDDIDLIDDDYDDEILNTSAELADTSLIDEFFGEDTLLKEFKQENAVVPSCSKYSNNPLNDIITCPICQEKLKRSDFSDHLDGCLGISQKVELPRHSKSKTAGTIKAKKSLPKKRAKSATGTREILLRAGYAEEDIEDLPAVNESTISQSDDDLNLSERQIRMRSVYTPTRTCPACCQEVDVDFINEHLDVCLSK